jgi:hypothetical protein
MQPPKTNTESAIPNSTGGTVTTNIPMIAPATIIAGKTTGRTYTSGRPRKAPQTPTETIANR